MTHLQKSGVVGKNKVKIKVVENFLRAARHLFSNFILVFPLYYLKSPPPPYLINNYNFMNYALFGMSTQDFIR